jgi:glutamate 5-kinase
VEGVFASHQAVNLVVRRRIRAGTTSTESRGSFEQQTPDETTGTTTPVSHDHGSRLGSPNWNLHMTAPGTPNLYPVLSLSSSIASLDALSLNGRNSVPQSPATFVRQVFQQETPADSVAATKGSEDNEKEVWEESIIGKGLALYNSVEIDRLKGVKR